MRKLIDVDQLMISLGVAEKCSDCPRNDDGRCKGHLQWMCRRLREADVVWPKNEGVKHEALR